MELSPQFHDSVKDFKRLILPIRRFNSCGVGKVEAAPKINLVNILVRDILGYYVLVWNIPPLDIS